MRLGFRIALALATLLTWQSPAWGAEPAADPKAEGDALLAQAHAADLFENTSLPLGQPITLRHKESGMRCWFNRSPEVTKRVIIYPRAKRGDDVGCNHETPWGTTNFRAVRAVGRSIDDVIDSAAAPFLLSHGDAEPLAIDDTAVRTKNGVTNWPGPYTLPASQTRRYTTAKTYEQLSAAIVNGWEITMRFSDSLGDGSVLAGLLYWDLQLGAMTHPIVAQSGTP